MALLHSFDDFLFGGSTLLWRHLCWYHVHSSSFATKPLLSGRLWRTWLVFLWE
jgi:hypothetical protein